MEAGKDSSGSTSFLWDILATLLLIIALRKLLDFVAPSISRSDVSHGIVVGISLPIGLWAGKTIAKRLAAKKEPASKEEGR